LDWSFKIISIDGKEVLINQYINSNDYQIDINRLTNGLYIIMISSNENQTEILRFIKE